MLLSLRRTGHAPRQAGKNIEMSRSRVAQAGARETRHRGPQSQKGFSERIEEVHRGRAGERPALALAGSGPGRVDTLEGDAEVERQVRLHVVVRLVATGGGDGVVGHVRRRGFWGVGEVRRGAVRTCNGVAARRKAV